MRQDSKHSYKACKVLKASYSKDESIVFIDAANQHY